MPQQHTQSILVISGVLVLMAVLPSSVSAQQAGQTQLERVQFTLSDSVRVVQDVVYGSYGERQLKLDLYLPRQPAEDLTPGVIVIRGGGWSQGDKEGYAHIAGYLAKEGLAAASIEYRVPPEATFPAAIHDIKAAVRWMRTNGKQYAINTEQIGAIGGSAGAHLAALLGTSHEISSLEGEGGNQEVSSRVQAVVAMATPGVDFVRSGQRPGGGGAIFNFLGVSLEQDRALWSLASPITHVDADSPPILLMHSDADRTVPYQQSVLLAERYKQAGAPVELVTIENAPHAFWNFAQWYEHIMGQASDFFKSTLSGASSGNPE